MSDRMMQFGDSLIALDYDLEARLAKWDALRMKMARGVPAEFTRDEWAYLVGFVAKEHLYEAFIVSFGMEGGDPAKSLVRPRGPIAIWLPSNVSLLGPLVLILSSFAGVPMRVKAGSKSHDLCAAFGQFAIKNLDEGELRDYLRDQVKIERFDRHDPRNAEMAANASVRIAFGSDAAMAAIHALPHPADSIGISFGDHRSEAWVEAGALDDAAVMTLMKVFAIYGQAGCTSPRRVAMLGGSEADCHALRDRMLKLWPMTMKADAPMHIASLNVMHTQLNAASGWDVKLAHRNGAALGVNPVDKAEMSGLMSLAIVPGTVEQAIAMLPPNVQTIGHHIAEASKLLPLIAKTKAKRFVPLAQMHHFGPVWDGQNFFRQLFEEVAL
jgi:hypothetical protein